MNKKRIEKVAQLLQENKLPQLLVSSPYSIFYLTGKWIFPGERMVTLLVNDQGEATLYAARLFALPGTVDMPLVEYDDTDDCVAVLSSGLKSGLVGVEKTWASHFTLRLMDARSDIKPVIGSHMIDMARLCKDEDEVALMKESSHRNDQTIEAAIARLRLGMTEREGADIYLEEAKAHGATGPSFEPLVCYGENCAEPHHSSDDVRRLREGDAIILDVGLSYKNYCSDMTRTVFLGSASDEQKRVYDLVCQANAAGRAAVRPGVPCRDVDRAARKVIEDAGYGKYFIHRTGHGIGLEVHEYPDISSTSEEICRPGMCFSVEPGIYLPGKFGVRVEDLVTVTEDGAVTMNEVPRELRIL